MSFPFEAPTDARAELLDAIAREAGDVNDRLAATAAAAHMLLVDSLALGQALATAQSLADVRAAGTAFVGIWQPLLDRLAAPEGDPTRVVLPFTVAGRDGATDDFAARVTAEAECLLAAL